MKKTQIHRLFVLASAILLMVPAVIAQQASMPQQQGAAPAAPPSFCGNRPGCYEGMDFAATVVDFRTSDANGVKVIDAIVRFQNKTNQVISLAYVDGSAFALDDRANRYGLNGYGGNGIRGMGVFYGNNVDSKFVLSPGGTGDVRFELLCRP